ncbi:MAG: phenylalanine--tRNA ligase subunit beta [Alphaproteobacteria bacterium]|nr:phenylalanine--tRNA ligase subunit beta [Alphaproteobacteria bacterium]
MKFTFSWLKEHLDTPASVGEIAHGLTMLGLEVESLTDRGAALKPFVIARVVEAKQHPNADRLRVCTVDPGTGQTLQVVCGAPNARTGMIGVFAPVGAYIPGTQLDLKKGTIRGVDSNGMLLSEREIGISDEHEGIIDLPADAPVGTSFAAYAGLDDPVFEVKLTPNRADCLGVAGIARDLAAAGYGSVITPPVRPVAGKFHSPLDVQFRLPPGDAAACPMFVGRYIRGVRNAPSPDWLQRKLEAIGLRPISALVDITNYVTFDRNRPLHVFDADKVTRGIRVRFGKPAEKMLALNGKEYQLDSFMTVISDEAGHALGLGGVIGGEESGCTERTVNVFVESALFDPKRTARTGRALGIDSDARHRFERGVDPEFAAPGMEVATRLILELCGGEPSEVVVAGGVPEWRRTLHLRHSRVAGLGGVEVPADRVQTILKSLGFGAQRKGDGFECEPPSWRADVEGEADLVEEVIRVNGFDNIEAVSMPAPAVTPEPALTPAQRRVALVKRALAQRGIMEAVTWSFMPRPAAELFGGGQAVLALANPISADLDQMRPSILPNLLGAAQRNADRGFPDLALFEVGPVYAGDKPEGQSTFATVVRRGNNAPRHWDARPRPVDAFDAKADALAVLASCGVPLGNLQIEAKPPAWYHPGRAGVLRLGPNVLATFGELHPRVLKRLDVEGPAVGCEVNLTLLPLPRAKAGRARPLLKASPFQPVVRDFAFVVDDAVAADQLVRAARAADKALIADVGVFDRFAGGSLPAGKKSIAIAVTLQPTEATLSEKEIEAVSAKVVAQVTKATGGVLRG